MPGDGAGESPLTPLPNSSLFVEFSGSVRNWRTCSEQRGIFSRGLESFSSSRTMTHAPHLPQTVPYSSGPQRAPSQSVAEEGGKPWWLFLNLPKFYQSGVVALQNCFLTYSLGVSAFSKCTSLQIAGSSWFLGPSPWSEHDSTPGGWVGFFFGRSVPGLDGWFDGE